MGSYTYDGGDIYVGEWKDDKRHGQGTYYYLENNRFKGDKYVGEWRNGDRHGRGTYIRANGDKYIGEFRGNKVSGHGTYYHLADNHNKGDIYVGEWKDSKKHGQGVYTSANGREREGIWEKNKFIYAQKISPTITARKSSPPQVRNNPNPPPPPPSKTGSTGSGFFVSKLGHIVTNEHVVQNCGSITVGDNAKKQVAVTLVETDKRNDLALLKISSTKMVSAETKTLIRKLGVKIVPLASEGLMRSDDVELGEDVLVSGYPYGDIFSNAIKVTKGIVSANRGMGDDIGQFQIDAAVQPGNSGGPIYDENGNIVGVVVAQLNKMKVAKAIGSLPENVNFGIKASTVRQFLTASGLPTKWSNRSKSMSTKDLAQIAMNQTLMVVCNP